MPNRPQPTSGRLGEPATADAARRNAQLVWYDPGVTTGVFVCSVRPRWLAGDGEASWDGLGRAMTVRWWGQLGRQSRVVVDGRAKPVPHDRAIVEGVRLIHEGRRARAGSAELTTSLAEETNTLMQALGVLDLWEDAAWGYEDFVPRSSNASREFLAPVRIFAALTFAELAYGEKGRVPFVQSASIAKTTATDDRLRAARLYMPGMGHATDAARHAATFLRRARVDPELRALAWPKLFRSSEAA